MEFTLRFKEAADLWECRQNEKSFCNSHALQVCAVSTSKTRLETSMNDPTAVAFAFNTLAGKIMTVALWMTSEKRETLQATPILNWLNFWTNTDKKHLLKYLVTITNHLCVGPNHLLDGSEKTLLMILIFNPTQKKDRKNELQARKRAKHLHKL